MLRHAYVVCAMLLYIAALVDDIIRCRRVYVYAAAYFYARRAESILIFTLTLMPAALRCLLYAYAAAMIRALRCLRASRHAMLSNMSRAMSVELSLRCAIRYATCYRAARCRISDIRYLPRC